MKKLIVLVLTLLFGMIFTLSACSQSNDAIIVTIEDGFVYVNGVNTNVSVKTEDGNKSAFEIWKEEFDALAEEGRMMNFVLHPQFMGRASRVQMLSDLIDYMRTGGAWFETNKAVAQYVLKQQGFHLT